MIYNKMPGPEQENMYRCLREGKVFCLFSWTSSVLFSQQKNLNNIIKICLMNTKHEEEKTTGYAVPAEP